MTNVLLKANGASLTAKVDGKITSGMIGIPVQIEYDSAWDGLTKTVIFRFGGFARVRKNVGTTTTVPWEVVRLPGKNLSVGIEGRNEDGSVVIPTIWATVGTVFPGANGEIPAAPNPDGEDAGNGDGAVIDDSQISTNTTWSSKKISEEIASADPESGGSGGGVGDLIVTLDDKSYASHTPAQIKEHVDNGGTVFLYTGTTYVALSTFTGTGALFAYVTAEDGTMYYVIGGNGFTEKSFIDPADKRDLNDAVADIDHELSLTVKSVNGIAPDENGNVQIETGIDEVETGGDTETDLFPTGTVQNWIMGYSGGKITFYANDTNCSVFIPVEAGKTYRMTVTKERPAYVDIRHAFFDVQDVNLIVANQAYTTDTYKKENVYIDTPISFTATKDGYYAIGVVIVDSGSVQFLTEHGTEPTTERRLSSGVKLAQEHIDQVKKAISTSNVTGKKLGVIGDSITVGYMVTDFNDDGTAKGGYVTKKWYDYVVERYGFASVQANAEIGRAFTKSGSMSTRFTQKIKELDSDLDVIIVFGGTNDFNWSPPIGTMDDAPSEENGGISFFSALRFTAEYLQTNFPNSRIVFMTPLPRKNSEGFNGKDTNGKRVLDYADAIAEMCRCYGFDMVDLNRVGGFYVWSDTWLNSYMLDGLHPNEAGTEIFVRNGILPKLDSIFLDR